MKKIIFTIFLLLICINVKAEKIEATYKKCIDGDTARFILNDEDIKVRFIGINAPEIEHEENEAEYYSEEAKDYTCKRLKQAKKVELEFDSNSDKQDKYGRYLAWIFVDGKLLQNEIVINGYAKVAYLYDDYKYSNTILKSEELAKKNKLGIWKEELNTSELNTNDIKKYKDIVILIGIFILYIILKKKR